MIDAVTSVPNFGFWLGVLIGLVIGWALALWFTGSRAAAKARAAALKDDIEEGLDDVIVEARQKIKDAAKRLGQ